MKKFLTIVLCLVLVISMVGCRQADKVSYNLSKQADAFNEVRQITVINCLQGDTIFQMTGKMSITADTEDNQLEVVVEDEPAVEAAPIEEAENTAEPDTITVS